LLQINRHGNLSLSECTVVLESSDLSSGNIKSFLIILGLEVVVAVIVLWTITFIKRRENDLILPEDKSDDSKTTVHSLNDKLP
jgi:hypothetical protein